MKVRNTKTNKTAFVGIIAGCSDDKFYRIGMHPKIKAKDGLYFDPELMGVTKKPTACKVIDYRPAEPDDPALAFYIWAYDEELITSLSISIMDSLPEGRQPFDINVGHLSISVAKPLPKKRRLFDINFGLPAAELPKGFRPRDFTTGVSATLMAR